MLDLFDISIEFYQGMYIVFKQDKHTTAYIICATLLANCYPNLDIVSWVYDSYFLVLELDAILFHVGEYNNNGIIFIDFFTVHCLASVRSICKIFQVIEISCAQ